MLQVKVQMDLIGQAVLTYPERPYTPQEIVDMVHNDRETIRSRLVADRSTATALWINSAMSGSGKGPEVMGRTPLEPAYADAGSLLESAIINNSPKDFYEALACLMMSESLIVNSVPRLVRKLIP
ncbi:hypothetical protein [Acidithiobacillus ferridurans]|uniref:Uncharacterized protein n=1 Tax=Acidithiobacillus ferridurans TaxID=1232575 RepID=A0A8X8K9C0_ACIFI|nr:hypothetical protein [Acidithiobacillus ferridurans]MBU2715609.1 hypothetical protein [Acidithiobacillus ferridurans]MBU2722901.1 hypothetical protein [Acidithiobacillus ferridurans]MBU2728207.1 hypothetical protein [Acidithiobacillus ferridurans]